MPRPRTPEIRWLLKTFPNLKLEAGSIPLKEWLNDEMKCWQKEIDLYKRRDKFRNARLRNRIKLTPVKNNAPEPESESADLTL